MQLSEEERLIRLLNDLAASNFQITADQRLRTLGLFMFLGLEDGVRRNRQRLRNLVGPVLCRSAEEQTRFRYIFKYWFPDEEPAADKDNGQVGGEIDKVLLQLAEERQSAVSEAGQRLRQAEHIAFQRQLRLVLALTIVAFLLSVILHFTLRYFVGSGAGAETAQTVIIPVSPVSATTPWPAASQPVPTMAPASPPAETSTPIPQPEPEHESNFLLRAWSVIDRTLGPATTLVLMVPITLLAMAIASSKKLLAIYARQTRVLPKKKLRNLLSQGGNVLEPGERFYHDVQPLRTRIDLPSNDLDVERTINATIAQAGAFCPVYANRHASPEYVALIDKRSHGDHLASYARFLVHALEQAGLNIVVYYFDRDPRRVTLGSGQRVLELEDLAHLSQTHRLLIFSDGECCLDPTTGAPFEWVRGLQDWQRAVLLTWKKPEDWNRSELILESRLGLPILPATEEGLIIAASLFNSENGNAAPSIASAPRSILPDRSRMYGFFATSGWRWVDDIAPSKEEIAGLIHRLRTDLGPRAFEWLTSLAVYPALYWNLTLYLGSRLLSPIGKGEQAGQPPLLEIARLPWLQFSHMPGWLREQLILKMEPAQRDHVHTVLEELLLTVTSSGTKDVTMEMGFPTDEGGRGLGRLDRDEHRRDSILIDFMTRKQASPTDYPLRSKVAGALGLRTLDGSARDFFSRRDLEAMRLAATEMDHFIVKHPPKIVLTILSDHYTVGDDVREITEWIDRHDVSATLPYKLYLIKSDPRSSIFTIIDEFSYLLSKRQKRLTFQFGLLGLVVMVIALGFYGSFWETLSSVGAGVGIVSALIYAPPILFWLLLVRPYSRILKNLPTISEEFLDP